MRVARYTLRFSFLSLNVRTIMEKGACISPPPDSEQPSPYHHHHRRQLDQIEIRWWQNQWRGGRRVTLANKRKKLQFIVYINRIVNIAYYSNEYNMFWINKCLNIRPNSLSINSLSISCITTMRLVVIDSRYYKLTIGLDYI